jgi:flagellar M-ring protein FliF
VRLVLGALILIALALGVLRPLIKSLASPPLMNSGSTVRELTADEHKAAGEGAVVSAPAAASLAYEQQIVNARNLVAQDPKRVAQVVKTWVAES